MGSPGYGAPMHVSLPYPPYNNGIFFFKLINYLLIDEVDDVDYPSWQAQIRGSKKWILEPPRECHYACSRLEVTVDPGEISEYCVFYFEKSSFRSFDERNFKHSHAFSFFQELKILQTTEKSVYKI